MEIRKDTTARPLAIAMLSIHSCPLGQLGGRDTGGMNVYVRELAMELGRYGHTVDIFTKSHNWQHDRNPDLGKNVRLIHLDTENQEDMPKVAIYVSLQNMLCGIENFKKNNSRQYDVIHSHYWLSGIMGKQLQTWWHIPHMTMFHTLGIPKNARSMLDDEPELRIESEKEIIRNCDRIIAATAAEKESLISSYNASTKQIAVIPCGVNMDLFQQIDKKTARSNLDLNHKHIVLFVGRFEHLKGLRQLLKAMSYIQGADPPGLVVVGGDEYSNLELQELRSMARELMIEQRTYFVGSVEQDMLPAYYSAADVCVIPSYYESFGMVALESLACGTPVVATDVGGMSQIIRDTTSGFIVPSNDPALMAERITRVLGMPNHVHDMAVRRSTVARFAWPEIARQILNQYEIISNTTGAARPA